MSLSFTPQGSTATPSSPDTTQIPFPPSELSPDTEPQQEFSPPPLEAHPQRENEHTKQKVETAETQEKVERSKPRLTRPSTTQPIQTISTPDPLTYQIEKIMEEGIAEAYQELTPVQKQEFKIKGEQTARQIRDILQSARVKVKKVFELIFEWLKLLPGVNRFFLMQEAKIKTDKIIGLKQK